MNEDVFGRVTFEGDDVLGIMWATKKIPGWLGYIGDEILPSYISGPGLY